MTFKKINRKERTEHKEKGVIATANAVWREAIQKTVSRGDAEARRKSFLPQRTQRPQKF
jgi:hypothetical protein